LKKTQSKTIVESLNSRITDKYVFLYYYALLNLQAAIKIKLKEYNAAYHLYERILIILEKPNGSAEIEKERALLTDDLGIIKYNLANTACVHL
jgi:hypothetical protein